MTTSEKLAIMKKHKVFLRFSKTSKGKHWGLAVYKGHKYTRSLLTPEGVIRGLYRLLYIHHRIE